VATILDRIVDAKRLEVASRMAERPVEAVVAAAASAPAARDFRAAITGPTPHGIHLIAEIKRKSPSAGLLVEDFDPVRIARSYYGAGASAISVLTDEAYFGGSLAMLAEVRASIPCPVLRKDFILDAYQVYEARAAGADAVLLIAEAVGVEQVASLHSVVEMLGMCALIEVHGADNLWAVIQRVGAKGTAHILGSQQSRSHRAAHRCPEYRPPCRATAGRNALCCGERYFPPGGCSYGTGGRGSGDPGG